MSQDRGNSSRSHWPRQAVNVSRCFTWLVLLIASLTAAHYPFTTDPMSECASMSSQCLRFSSGNPTPRFFSTECTRVVFYIAQSPKFPLKNGNIRYSAVNRSISATRTYPMALNAFSNKQIEIYYISSLHA